MWIQHYEIKPEGNEMWVCLVTSDSLWPGPLDCTPPGSSVHGIFQANT